MEGSVSAGKIARDRPGPGVGRHQRFDRGPLGRAGVTGPHWPGRHVPLKGVGEVFRRPGYQVSQLLEKAGVPTVSKLPVAGVTAVVGEVIAKWMIPGTAATASFQSDG